MTIAPPNLLALHRILAEAGDEAAALRSAVDRVIAGDADSLDAELGLKPGPGERNWRTVAALQRRDDLIRRAAAEHFADLTNREAAEQIASALSRFRNSHDWRRSRAATTCPLLGVKATWWSVLKLRDQPIGAERIRQILGR
ncbi:hypothetical protein I6F11_17665 [Ensifer sp. NBAIM29]|nr:hypothetical protein [Ensifer sp. NBAIM29]